MGGESLRDELKAPVQEAKAGNFADLFKLFDDNKITLEDYVALMRDARRNHVRKQLAIEAPRNATKVADLKELKIAKEIAQKYYNFLSGYKKKFPELKDASSPNPDNYGPETPLLNPTNKI